MKAQKSISVKCGKLVNVRVSTLLAPWELATEGMVILCLISFMHRIETPKIRSVSFVYPLVNLI